MLAVYGFDQSYPLCAVMRDRVHQVMATAHWGEFTVSQVIERQVNGAAPAVTRLGGHVSIFDNLGSAYIRIVP